MLSHTSMTVRARIAIQHFMADPKYTISTKTRAYIREVSEFCPEVSYISRKLALHCLTSRYHNTICLYHIGHDKGCKTNDTNPPNSHQLTGVPWVRNFNPKKKLPSKERVKLEPGILHCGCPEDDALWDFLWWKTTILLTPTSDIREPWRSSHLDPRSRAFMVTFIRSITYLDIDDIYSGTTDNHRTNLGILRKMEECILAARMATEEEIKRRAIM